MKTKIILPNKIIRKQLLDARDYLKAIGGTVDLLSENSVRINIPEYRDDPQSYTLKAFIRLTGAEAEISF